MDLEKENELMKQEWEKEKAILLAQKDKMQEECAALQNQIKEK